MTEAGQKSLLPANVVVELREAIILSALLA